MRTRPTVVTRGAAISIIRKRVDRGVRYRELTAMWAGESEAVSLMPKRHDKPTVGKPYA